MSVRQRLLNISVAHVLQQGEPSVEPRPHVNGEFRCVYRDKDGKGCAAAPFIIEYDKKMENLSWTAVCNAVYRGDLSVKLDETASSLHGFVSDLQSLHDHAAIDPKTCKVRSKEEFIRIYKEKLILFCAKRHLELPAIVN